LSGKFKEYWIHAHPDFITYNKEKLLNHSKISQEKSKKDITEFDLTENSEVAKMLP